MSETEGVIKFQLEFDQNESVQACHIAELDSWRHIFYRLQLIGQQAERYQGYGFGNISQRHPEFLQQFFISGSQTGGAAFLKPQQYALVTECDPLNNRIVASGKIKPSSEAMTHGQVYQLDPTANCVIHVHSPEIWKHADELKIPQTTADVPYGTVAMAQEVVRLFDESDVKKQKIFSMKGHEDGVVCFAENLSVASHLMIDIFNRTLKLGA